MFELEQWASEFTYADHLSECIRPLFSTLVLSLQIVIQIENVAGKVVGAREVAQTMRRKFEMAAKAVTVSVASASANLNHPVLGKGVTALVTRNGVMDVF